jgi:biotin carboxylase
VLVTSGEHTGPLAAVRALRAAGYEPWAAVSTPTAYAARSRAPAGVTLLPSSRTEPEAFVRLLRERARAWGAELVLPGTGRDMLAMARCREWLGDLGLATPPLARVLDATSKRHVNHLAAEAGLEVPETVELTRGRLLDAPELPMPVMVKPMRSEIESADGALVRGHVERIDTRAQLAETARMSPSAERMLVQPAIEGRLGAISGVAWEGTMVLAVHQVSRRIWPPHAGVSAYAETVAPDLALEGRLAGLIRLLGWSGIFQAQFILADEAAYFIDLNPRIYGSLALSVAAGANLPAVWVDLLARSDVDTAIDAARSARGYRAGVRYRHAELDARALLHAVRSRDLRAAADVLLPRRVTTHAVATAADPLPLLTSLGKLRRRILDPPGRAGAPAAGTSGRPAVAS